MHITTSHFVLQSKHADRPIAVDATYSEDNQYKPIVIFIHGFKGFKDWGTFPLIAREFAVQGFVFIKLNLSHNGTTPEQPTDFADLEAFGQNNFSIELDDIGVLIQSLFAKETPVPTTEIDPDQLYLVGHSRGGGLTILKAREDHRVKKAVTWASVADFANLWRGISEEEWRTKGVVYIPNSRTKQEMPLYYQLYQDYAQRPDRTNIRQAARHLTTPLLLIHGDADETVSVESAQELRNLHEHALLHIVKGAGHTFGGTHPFAATQLPEATQEVVSMTIDFLKNGPAGAN